MRKKAFKSEIGMHLKEEKIKIKEKIIKKRKK